MKRWGILCLALLALIGSGSSQAADESAHTWIAYMIAADESAQIESQQIYLLDPDDGTTHLLVNVNTQIHGQWVSNLRWSGTQFVFESQDGIYLLDLEGHIQHLLAGTSEYLDFVSPTVGYVITQAQRTPLWSPDGRWIALMIASGDDDTSNAFRLYRLDSNRTGVQGVDDLQLVGETRYEFYATVNFSWSPDSQKLLYLDQEWPSPVFHIFDIETGMTTTITPQGPINELLLPAWSPDGEWIAAIGYNSDSSLQNLYRMHPDGSEVQALLPDGCPVLCGPPIWSPDGQRIAFWYLTAFDAPDDLYVMNADGSDLQRLTALPSDVPIVWSPDGQWIAYGNGCDEGDLWKLCLYRIRTDGSGEPEILTTSRILAYQGIVWFNED